MGLFDKIFGGKDKNKDSEKKPESKSIPTIEEFPTLDSRNRMAIIMAVGDTGNIDYFPFLKYAILNDDDINVKFAALKRIHLFKDHSETFTILTEMKNNGAGEKFEPYFSMALSRLDIISLQEFQDKMNK